MGADVAWDGDWSQAEWAAWEEEGDWGEGDWGDSSEWDNAAWERSKISSIDRLSGKIVYHFRYR